ncbi:MAG: alkaline phosphatase PhoX [Planctomycetota bacterium]
MQSRRDFLQSAAAVAVGFAGLQRHVFAVTDTNAAPAVGYGPLRRDPAGVFDLPDGFTYKILSTKGDPMDDGLVVPGAPDGMAAFEGEPGKTVLIRNHELDPNALASSPFIGVRDRKPYLEKFYDRGWQMTPSIGGTTNLVVDNETLEVEREFLSLGGTVRNCAGGPTPWGSWITCEETNVGPSQMCEQWHGYNFEVPASATGLVEPVPLREMGRFQHEAVAVDPRSGIVYQTEDRGDGLIYRFIPNVPGELAKGGTLQAMKARDRRTFDARNWDPVPEIKPGESIPVEWIDLEDYVECHDDSLRHRGAADGAIVFARGEGMWYGDGEIYFACTNGGIEKKGQIWRYVPDTETLELFVEPNDGEVVDNADNLTVAPWGDLIVCEDGPGEQFLRGVTPEGKFYTLARNRAPGNSEFAGVCFGPDGKTLFVNIQKNGLTLAVRGNW